MYDCAPHGDVTNVFCDRDTARFSSLSVLLTSRSQNNVFYDGLRIAKVPKPPYDAILHSDNTTFRCCKLDTIKLPSTAHDVMSQTDADL